MGTPRDTIHKAVVGYITSSLGYKVAGRPTADSPVVFFDQLTTQKIKDTKDSEVWQVSFILEACALSQGQAYSTLNAIIDSDIDTLTYSGYTQTDFEFGEVTPMEEDTDTDTLFRQIQRIEMTLITNN